MIRPQRAAVVPRVLSEVSGDPFPVEEALLPHLGQRGAIAILGSAGSGKTTALAHLAAAFPGRLAIFDEGAPLAEVRDAAAAGLAVYAASRIHRLPHLATLLLAPWGTDEALEYMTAVHPDACGDVLARMVADPGRARLGGVARLSCAVLDRMAAGAKTVAAALLEIATGAALLDPILEHPAIRILRHAHELALDIRAGSDKWPARSVHEEPEVIREAAKLLAGDTAARDALARLCDGPVDRRQPTAASLLVALDPLWKPRGVPRLDGACLGGVSWRAVELRGAILRRADLSGADLDAAVFDEADARHASFRGARLRGASFRGTRLEDADLRGADLAGAHLAHADLSGANLRRARLPGADLAEANLLRARVEGADLSGATLAGARCEGLDLRAARLGGTNFSAADLEAAVLDGADARRASFRGARLRGTSLCEARLPDSDLEGADLTGAHLALATLSGADLRGANFLDASFHLGSSRSGLVESFLASEGTRTGFYTDDYDEQHFKAPEEIRKADLRGADLRRADVFGADFYLVDLRGAHYDKVQEAHFRRCRAILGPERR